MTMSDATTSPRVYLPQDFPRRWPETISLGRVGTDETMPYERMRTCRMEHVRAGRGDCVRCSECGMRVIAADPMVRCPMCGAVIVGDGDE